MLAPPAADQPEMEAVFRLDEPGRYAVEVEVMGAQGERGVVQFQTDVIPVSYAVRLLILMQVAIAGVAGVWLLSVAKKAWANTPDFAQAG